MFGKDVSAKYMKSTTYWKRLLGFTAASALLIVPFRFLVVNAVVVSPTSPVIKHAAVRSNAFTGGIYDGVLMKMSDLTYSHLNSYVGDSLQQLENLSATQSGPAGIYEQVQNIDTTDWHVPYSSANQFFFSDLQNWKIIDVQDGESQTGFYAVAFQQGNSVVIAFRGTNDVQDLVSDAGIYLSVPNIIDQMGPARKFVKRVEQSLPSGKYQLVFTGHSMGAWLAQMMYADYLDKNPNWQVAGATVFDSIGTGFHSSVSGLASVKDYHFDGDVFSHFGSSLGQEIDIPNPNPDQSIYDKHQMYDFYPYFYPTAEATSYAETRHLPSAD